MRKLTLRLENERGDVAEQKDFQFAETEEVLLSLHARLDEMEKEKQEPWKKGAPLEWTEGDGGRDLPQA